MIHSRWLIQLVSVTLLLFYLTSGFTGEKEAVSWYRLTITPNGEMVFPDEQRASEFIPDLPMVEMSVPTAEDSIYLPLFDEDSEILQQDETIIKEIDDGGKKRMPVGCQVTNAILKYGVVADNPLQFPVAVTSPAPGAANNQQTGPVSGIIPGDTRHVVATAFEYHSDLNGNHGCSSEQGKKGQTITTIKNNPVPAVTGLVGGSFGRGIQGDFFLDPGYTGDTRTGIRRAGGGVLYEGTQNKIHWVDAPNQIAAPAAAMANHVVINLALIMSVTKNGDGVTGLACISGHTHIVEYNAAGVPGTMNAAQARTYLDGLQPNGAAPGETPQQIQARRDATDLVKTPAANGGFQGQNNPEFRNLGCYSL